MVWYIPTTWFKKEEMAQDNGKKAPLYCDNPQCKGAILEEPLAYDKGNREVYHNGECALFANAHRALSSRCMVVSNINYITLDTAMDLLQKGELKQKSGLEEKLE